MLLLVVFEVALAVGALFGLSAFVVGRMGTPLAPASPDAAGDGLPPGPLRPEDVDRIRFGLAFRGYRMQEVDDALDRLRGELGEREEEIRRLRLLASVAPTAPAALDVLPPSDVPPSTRDAASLDAG